MEGYIQISFFLGRISSLFEEKIDYYSYIPNTNCYILEISRHMEVIRIVHV